VASVPKLFPPSQPPAGGFELSWIQFSYQANLFQPLTGLWGIGGIDSSYASGIAPLGLSMFVEQATPGPGPDYFLDTNLVIETPVTSAASAGLAYELVDAQNYYDVALAVDGTATLNQTIGAVRSVVATAQWQGGLNNFQLGVIRFQDKTTIEVDGKRIFNEVPQAPLAIHNWGVTSDENEALFNFLYQYYTF